LKRLILIRHAKSDWSSNISDFERTLNEKGLRDAQKMGQFLKLNEIIPDLIISSGAKRAFSTAELISQSLTHNDKIVVKNEIYNAASDVIKNVVNKIEESYNTVFLVAHNPGLSNLIDNLSGQYIDLQTCCVAILEISVENWNQIIKDTAILKEHYNPKNIV
jgi:phosphohistidine phosphatase